MLIRVLCVQIDELLIQSERFALQDNPQPMQIPGHWGQGRTCYGGLSGALAYHALKQKVAVDRVMRSFSCNFVGPLILEEDFHIEVELLRQGKSATQAAGRIVQNGKVAVLVQASFGVARQSKIVVENNDQHGMQLPQKAKFLPQIPKITPKFLRHIDLAINKGALPMTGSKQSCYHGWMRFKQPPQRIEDGHIIALIDAWPPTILQKLRWPAPASSMCWNIEFIHPHSEMQPTDWLAYQAETRQAANGYAHTEANIWDQQGELIAISRQVVAVFD